MKRDGIKQYAQILSVLNAQKTQIEQKLAAIKTKEHHIQMYIDFADREFEKLATIDLKSVQASHAVGLHDPWISYNRDQKRSLNQQLAGLRGEREDVQIELRKAHAQVEMVKSLINEAEHGLKRKADARLQETCLAPYLLR